MKKTEKTLVYNIYSNDEETEEIREIKGISIMNRRKKTNGEWGIWIPCDVPLAKLIMETWEHKDKEDK